MRFFELTDHCHKMTKYYCDYCDWNCHEESTMDEHLKSEHLDIIESHDITQNTETQDGSVTK